LFVAVFSVAVFATIIFLATRGGIDWRQESVGLTSTAMPADVVPAMPTHASTNPTQTVVYVVTPSPAPTATPDPTRTATPYVTPTLEATATATSTSAPTPTQEIALSTSEIIAVGVSSCSNVDARITTPRSGDSISGVVAFWGSAQTPSYQYHKFDYRPIGEQGWRFLTRIDRPIKDGVLMEWHTSTVPPGEYELRLVVVDRTGNYPEPCTVRLRVR
jgi:hypothetical protein